MIVTRISNCAMVESAKFAEIRHVFVLALCDQKMAVTVCMINFSRQENHTYGVGGFHRTR